jgi:hypothetical protein
MSTVMPRLKYAITTAATAGTTAVVASVAAWAALSGSGAAAATAARSTATASVRPADAPTGPGGTWGHAQAVRGLAALVPSGSAFAGAAVASLSCSAQGSCVAVGTVTGTSAKTDDTQLPFIVAESLGTWGAAMPVPGLTHLAGAQSAQGQLSSVSCSADGDCTAIGSYGPPGNATFFSVEQQGWAWHDAQALPSLAGFPAASLATISCSSYINCTVVGSFTDPAAGQRMPLALSEVDHVWGAPLPISGIPALTGDSTGSLTSETVVCTAECTVGGTITHGPNNTQTLGFTAVQQASTWTAVSVPGLGTVDGLSCPGEIAGSCTAIGHGGVASQVNGTWESAQPLALPNGYPRAFLNSLSCSSPGTCAVSGTLLDELDNSHPFVASAAHGTWGPALPLAGINLVDGTASLVSCPGDGTCSTVGWGQERDRGIGLQVFAADQVDGTWGPARSVPGGTDTSQGHPDLIALSCGVPRYCVAVGNSGGDVAQVTPLILREATASAVTVTASASSVPYGSTQTVRLTAKVSPAAGGTPADAAAGPPAGTVTVTAGLTAPVLCTMTLTAGTGTCQFPAKSLPAAKASLTALYNGDLNYAATAATVPLTVVKAATSTSVKLSAASVPYGHENAVKVTIAVKSQFGGRPTSEVHVSVGPGHSYTGRLSNGGYSFTLPARLLPVGRYPVKATYQGDANFNASAFSTTLTVTKANALPKLTLSTGSVRFGHENSVRLTVTVSPRYSGTPTGTVVIKAGGTGICTIKLSNAAGNCTLPATRLKAGTYRLSATYSGSGAFHSATSPQVTLTITR